MNNSKFFLKCTNCENKLNNYNEWLQAGQKCPKCGKNHVEVFYLNDYSLFKKLLAENNNENTIWRYFDFLPLLNKRNIISNGEGDISINRWEFLEKFAKEQYNTNCKVYVYRNDENRGTNTFKDAGASLAASVLKENEVKEYVVASTGNVANAFAFYFAKAGISLSAFISNDALKMNAAGVSYYGQKVFRAKGDYAKAKQLAADYAAKYNILMTIGNTDPLRVEAKRTMVFEWLRRMSEFPTVYIQSLSGGTGPIAIEKGIREISSLNLIKETPRFLLAQPDGCAPMAAAWDEAKANNFPEGWNTRYPVYANPKTSVPTLATGNPGSYPLISKLVRNSGGEIFSVKESRSLDIVRLVAYESLTRIGPASAIALGGFFDALKNKMIKEGDVIMINIGEGIDRAPDFFENLIYTEQEIASIDECVRFNRNDLRQSLWNKVIENN